ncbi:hypothetical protein Q3G72_000364 [Acer saccharum]|nr:hypothetical protein Q3G72_000364 [Acer saccharum]
MVNSLTLTVLKTRSQNSETNLGMLITGLKKIIDPRLSDEFIKEKLDRMMIALLCMADDRDARPPMSFCPDMINQQHQAQIMRRS